MPKENISHFKRLSTKIQKPYIEQPTPLIFLCVLKTETGRYNEKDREFNKLRKYTAWT